MKTVYDTQGRPTTVADEDVDAMIKYCGYTLTTDKVVGAVGRTLPDHQPPKVTSRKEVPSTEGKE